MARLGYSLIVTDVDFRLHAQPAVNLLYLIASANYPKLLNELRMRYRYVLRYSVKQVS